MALIDYKKYSSEIRTIVAVAGVVCVWGDLKTDIAVHHESHKLIEFRLSALENKIALTADKPYALTPKSPEVETELKRRR